MCGIVGKFGSLGYKELEFYWDMLNHRGNDSFGTAVYNNKTQKLFTYKALIESSFERNKEINYADWIIAHNRWASIGGKSDIKLAHPVAVKGVYIIHNGTKRSLYESIKSAKSDTHAIGLIYTKLADKSDILEFLNGSGVCFIIDKNEDRIIFHKDKSRTLYYSKDLQMFASEPIEVGKWQMVQEQNRILSMSAFKETWNKKIKLQKNVFELTKNITIDICPVCFKEKLMNEADGRCPDCVYQNKKEEKWDFWSKKSKNKTQVDDYPYYTYPSSYNSII